MQTTTITSLDQLNASKPTVITADTHVEIDGCHIVFTGNTGSCVERGARWHLVTDEGCTPIRALVIG